MNFNLLLLPMVLFMFVYCSKNNAEDKVVYTEKSKIVFSVFKDERDDNVYKTVAINGTSWFAENLRYDTLGFSNSVCIIKDSCTTFGRVYTFAIADNVCPSGWHLPSDTEWKELEEGMGMAKEELDREGVMRGINGKRSEEQWKLMGIYFKGSAAFLNNIITLKPNNYSSAYWTSSSKGKDYENKLVRIFYPAFNIGRVSINVKRDSSLFYIRCKKD